MAGSPAESPTVGNPLSCHTGSKRVAGHVGAADVVNRDRNLVALRIIQGSERGLAVDVPELDRCGARCAAA